MANNLIMILKFLKIEHILRLEIVTTWFQHVIDVIDNIWFQSINNINITREVLNLLVPPHVEPPNQSPETRRCVWCINSCTGADGSIHQKWDP